MFNRSHISIGRASTPQSLYYCLFAPHIYGAFLCTHPVRGEWHIQRNANREVVTLPTTKNKIHLKLNTNNVANNPDPNKLETYEYLKTLAYKTKNYIKA